MITIKMNKPIWVIGDIHGEYDKLINLINKLPKNANVVMVGDLIDRGPKSKEVIDYAINNNIKVVYGNHEDMFAYNRFNWKIYGGKDTLKSFEGISNQKYLEYLNWAKNLPTIIKYSYENEKPLYVSHSSILLYKNDKEILQNNTVRSIIWNRKTKPEVNFAINIHGHTITPKDKMYESKSHIDIDNGAFLNKEDKDGCGDLAAIEYPSLKVTYSD